jgi:hypothetical protein
VLSDTQGVARPFQGNKISTNDGVEVVTNDVLEVFFGDAHWSKQKEPSLRDTEYASLAKPEELRSTEWIEEI